MKHANSITKKSYLLLKLLRYEALVYLWMKHRSGFAQQFDAIIYKIQQSDTSARIGSLFAIGKAIENKSVKKTKFINFDGDMSMEILNLSNPIGPR